MSKDIWFDHYVRELNELEERGITGRQADELAAERAQVATRETYADMIDEARMRKKEGL